MPEYVDTTTESYRVRHLARPADLTTSPHGPGRSGRPLCRVNNLDGVIDQQRATFWREGFTPGARPLVIADLPLCKRCAKTAGNTSTKPLPHTGQ